MTLRSFLFATVAVTSIGLIAPLPSLSFEYAGLADDVGNATVSVLGKLGYDCKNISAAAIACKKCKLDSNKQKCTAYLCDVATRKCRQKSAEIPNLPNLRGNGADDADDGVNLPSL